MADQDPQQTEPFAMVPSRILSHPELTPAEKVVYAAIAMHCGRKGSWRIGQVLLARKAGLTPRTVTRSVKRLRELGIIATSGNGKSLQYTVLVSCASVSLSSLAAPPSDSMSSEVHCSDSMPEQVRQDVGSAPTECRRDHKTSPKNTSDKDMHGDRRMEGFTDQERKAASALSEIGFDHPEKFVRQHRLGDQEVMRAIRTARNRGANTVRNLPGLVRMLLEERWGPGAVPGPTSPAANQRPPSSIREQYLRRR